MKRVLSVLLTLCVCALLLSGCHGSMGLRTFTIPDALTDKPIELTFWAKNDTNQTQTDIYKQAIADFEALYPNITVKLRLYTDYAKIYNDVITCISTNTTPNVCITYPDHIATYLTGQNVVVPLDELMGNEKYGLGGSELLFDSPTQDEIVPQFLSECCIGDACYALPYMRSMEACYINKDLVEALGYELPETLTWDFIWEVSEAALEQDEDSTYLVNNQKVMIPFIYKSTDNMMIQMVRQLDAGYSTEDGEVLLFNDDTKKLLLDIAPHAQSKAFSTFKISSYPGNFLNAGQCIFGIDSTAGATWMGTDAPNLDISPDKLVRFNMAVMPIPQFDPSDPRMISQGPSLCIFNKDDPQVVLASWLFMQFLLTNDVQIAYAQTEGYVPVTTKAQNSAEYTDYLSRSGEDNELYYSVKLDATKLLLDNIANTFVTPVFNGSASLRDAAGQMIENVTKSVRRKQTVDDAYIDQLYADMTALYRLDQLGAAANESEELGPLPGTAVALLVSLAAAWVLIIAYVAANILKNKKRLNRL